MPYDIVHEDDKYYVLNKDTGDKTPKDGYATREEADRYLAALHANVPDAKTVKINYIDMSADTYWHGPAIKALGAGRVGGYLINWGLPRDKQGEYFRSDCELHLDWFDGVKRPILYHHGLTEKDAIEDIGQITSLRRDSNGLWAEGQLDMSNPRAVAVYNSIQQGKIGWSSGSAEHLSKVEEDGGISEWALIEATLTPTPAGGRRTAVAALKFDFTSTSLTADPEDAGARIEDTPAQEVKTNDKTRIKRTPGETKMGTNSLMIAALEKAGADPAMILEVLKEMGDADGDEMMAAPQDGAVPPAPDMSQMPEKDAGPVTTGDAATISDSGSTPPMQPPGERIVIPGKAAHDNSMAKLMADVLKMKFDSMKTAPAASKAGGSYTGESPIRDHTRITDMRTKWHSLSAEDMAFYQTMREGGKRPIKLGIEYEREMADKAMKAYRDNKLELDDETYRKVSIKADFNNTINATEGANWVPDLWSSALWQRVRIDNNVAKNVEVFQMPSPTFEYPIESTDPIVYAVGESDTDAEQTLATNVFTRSKLAVNKLQFSAKKTGLQVGFSTEIEEDSIIPFIPQLRAQATRAFANSIDNNILNSDSTTGTGNINYKGANTSAASTSNFLFGGGQGMRYNALVTNTAMLNNFMGGIPTLQGIRTTRFKMLSALNAYGINPEDLCIIVDKYTYGKFLNIDELNVFMNNGRGATVNTGIVPSIDGTDVYASAELALTDSTGYALADGSGTLGNFVIFAKNAWKVGYVRQVMTDVSYVPWNDSYILTMTARYAIGKKDTVASAVGYNINVN